MSFFTEGQVLKEDDERMLAGACEWQSRLS
jgi:hypothetical protein